MRCARRLLFTLIPPTVFVASAVLITSGGCRGNFDPSGGGTAIGGDEFLGSGRTLSFFQAIQVDPRSEDSAGPQFVKAADVNGDGLMDLISAWNQSQPVQVHLQRRTNSGGILFETLTLAGNVPVVAVAGLAVDDFNLDGLADIAVLVKVSLLPEPQCLDSDFPPDGTMSGAVVLYLGPSDASQTNQALAWNEVVLEASRLPAPMALPALPEDEGFTDMAVGDMNLDGLPDVVLASNSSCNEGEADVVIFLNGGPGAVLDGTWQTVVVPNPFPRTVIKSVDLGDIDRDGDLDIMATFPASPTLNVRWFRNPTVDTPDDVHISNGEWQVGPIAQVATGADVARLADVDNDGVLDVVVRSTNGLLIQWMRGPEDPTTAPVRNIPWQVFTIAEFTERTPNAIAMGDINNDGELDLVASAGGGLAWFDRRTPVSIFDQWGEVLILDDDGETDGVAEPATTDPSVEPSEIELGTLINSIEMVDLDGDGRLDFVATFDRNGNSGLTNDALVWLRNTSGPLN